MLIKLTVIVAVAMNRTGHQNADYFKYARVLRFTFNNAIRSFLAQHHSSQTICSQLMKNRCAAGEVRWMITDVVGLEEGLGVECLSGSGAIASAYAKAYKEGLTITLVSGRTVGIGAYLARLGRRCVQRADQPIILTGYAALNKLLGREVYTSHMQLGGPKVIH